MQTIWVVLFVGFLLTLLFVVIDGGADAERNRKLGAQFEEECRTLNAELASDRKRRGELLTATPVDLSSREPRQRNQ